MDSYSVDVFNELVTMDTVPEVPWEAAAVIETDQVPYTQPQDPSQVGKEPVSSKATNQIDEHLCQRRQYLANVVHQLKQLQQLHKMLKQMNKHLRQEILSAEWAKKLYFDSNIDQGRPQTATGLPEYTGPLDIPIPPQEAVPLPEIGTANGALQPSIDRSLQKLRAIETRIEMLRAPWIKLRDSSIQLRAEFNDLEKRMRQVRAYKEYIDEHPGAFNLFPGPAPPGQQPIWSPPQATYDQQNNIAVAPSITLGPSTQPSNPGYIDLTLDDGDDDVHIIDPPQAASNKAPIPEWRKRMAGKTMGWYNKTTAAPTQIKELGGPLFKTLNREARMARPYWKGNLKHDQIKTSWNPSGLLASISVANNQSPKSKKRAREASQQQHQEDARIQKRARTRKAPPKIPLSKEPEQEPEQSPLEPAITTADDFDEDAAQMAALLEGEAPVISSATADFEHQSYVVPETVDPKELESMDNPPTSIPAPISAVEETVRQVGEPNWFEDFQSRDFSPEDFDAEGFMIPGFDKIAEQLDRELFGESP